VLVPEAEFLEKLDKIAEAAFDDQCTGANPRFPLIAEIKQLLLDSYYGRVYAESYDRGRESDTPVLRLQPRIVG
jgi:acetaldehyde dehydrogenase/alcohol dehydrogenase